MKLTRRLAWSLLLLELTCLLVGTQIPGAWRNAIEHTLHAPWTLSGWAHFFLFALMAGQAGAPPLAWPKYRVIAAMLALALLTEGLQFFAIDRQPSWLDVAIDMAGASVGLLFASWLRARSAASARLYIPE